MKTFLAIVAVFASSSSFAASTPTIQYSRDGRYIYEKTAMPLSLSMSPEQSTSLKEATKKITEQLTGLQGINPRAGLRGTIDRTVIESAATFEKSLDSLIDYAGKYFVSMEPVGFKITKAVPTAFIVFSGFEVTGGFGLSGGGSVMLGSVFVPMHVTRIDVDTNEKVEYTEFDSNLVVWPSANVGVGAGGGGNFRGGVGLIWGNLNNAKEFAGLVVGPSISADLGFGSNFKLQFLRNWSKRGSINNVFVTAGAEMGLSARVEGHGNIAYLIDAEAYLRGGQNAVEKLLKKFFSSAPQADKPVDTAALETGTVIL